MFKTNLKIAWRNLIKDKQFTFLNVMGLSAGIACSLLIFLWVQDELKFDHFLSNSNRLYQLMEKSEPNGNTSISDGSSGPLVKPLHWKCPRLNLHRHWHRPDGSRNLH